MKAKLAEKCKELDQANKDKKRLAKDLAEAQAKDKDVVNDDTDKCSKLTGLLKTQKADTKKATDEVKKVNIANKELQTKLNKANNENASLVAKTTRLEKQVDDLIETCGQKLTDVNRRVSFENQKSIEKTVDKSQSQVKCFHNDKGRCRNGDECGFAHSNVVCKSFSKLAFCENQEQCPLRHPTGICMYWRGGQCEKEFMCFYRHPEDEFGSMKNDGQRTPDLKRRRTFSNQNISCSPDRSSENNFVYQKVLELTKQLEAQNNPRQSDQMSRSNLSDQSEQFSRQSQPGKFVRTGTSDQTSRQPDPSYFTTPTGPVQPMQVPGWSMGHMVVPQWGTQEMFQGNQKF